MSLWWWRYDKAVLISRLGADECLARLRNVTDSEWKLFNRGDVTASIGTRGFRLRKRQPFFFSNRAQTMLYGKLSDTRQGTRIDCRLGLQYLQFGFICFFLLWIWVGVGLFGIAQHSAFNWQALLFALIGPVLMTTIVTLALTFGRWRARYDDAYLLNFLAEVTEARSTGEREASMTVERR